MRTSHLRETQHTLWLHFNCLAIGVRKARQMNMFSNLILLQPRIAVSGSLRRPRLLVQAARHAQAGWRRERDLRRLLKSDDPDGPIDLITAWLRQEEARLEQSRRDGAAAYDPHRHILVLAAILHENMLAAARLSDLGTAIPARL